MKEILRQQYLNRLGVSVWYARTSLKGAAPSPAFIFESQEVTADEADKSAISVADTLAQLKASLPADALPANEMVVRSKELPSQNASSSVAEILSEEPVEAVKQEAVVVLQDLDLPVSQLPSEIHLMAWLLPSGLFISEINAQLPPALHESLLFNMMNACALSPGSLSETHTLSWPPFSNARLPGNNASGLVRAFGRLLATLKVNEQPLCILMGAQVKLLFETLQTEVVVSSGEFTTDLSKSEFVFFPSLGDILHQPSLKAGVWRQLVASIK